MNALARSDLQSAFKIVKTMQDESNAREVDPSVETGLLRDAVEKLCHVCQALSEENENLTAELNRRIPHGYVTYSN